MLEMSRPKVFMSGVFEFYLSPRMRGVFKNKEALFDSTIYDFQDNFTLCVLMKGDKVVSTGVSKRNPEKDEYNVMVGVVAALSRAINRL